MKLEEKKKKRLEGHIEISGPFFIQDDLDHLKRFLSLL